MHPESVVIYERVLKGEYWPKQYVGTPTTINRSIEILRFLFLKSWSFVITSQHGRHWIGILSPNTGFSRLLKEFQSHRSFYRMNTIMFYGCFFPSVGKGGMRLYSRCTARCFRENATDSLDCIFLIRPKASTGRMFAFGISADVFCICPERESHGNSAIRKGYICWQSTNCG